MAIKFARDIVKQIRERGPIKVPNGCVTGEAFEKWLVESKAYIANQDTMDERKEKTMNNNKVQVKINYHGTQPIGKIAVGDWIDLRAAETVELKQGEYKAISLGVSMELPEGYEAHVLPRSSTFKKYGILLVNSMGIIDNTYCGNDDIWSFPALAMRDTVIQKGERIAQFRVMRNQPEIEFIEVDKLENENRGGLGSTGRM